MKRFSEQFNTKSKSIRLSAAEKAELRERLVSYMEYHPLPGTLQSAKTASVATETFKTITIPFAALFKSSALVAAFMLVVVPFMAERSVPGDGLYAVKIQFNEELRSTLTFDGVEKVAWETERVNRRIAEARLLASEGRLTEEVEAEVAQAVRVHTQNAQREIALLREEDVEEATIASIAFDSTLEAQATSLKDNDNNGEAADESSEINLPNLIAAAVAESRSLNEQPTASSTPSYDKLMARVEQNTTRMYELLDSVDDADPEAIKDITRRIEDIERSIAVAIDKSDDSTQESQLILVDVLKRTQKLIVFITDIEVSQTVTIEEIVPMVLTNDEEVSKLTAFNDEIAQKLSQIELQLTTNTTINQGVINKAQKGLLEIKSFQQQIADATDFKSSESLAVTALELADDIVKMLPTATTTPAGLGTSSSTPATATASTTATTTVDA